MSLQHSEPVRKLVGVAQWKMRVPPNGALPQALRCHIPSAVRLRKYSSRSRMMTTLGASRRSVDRGLRPLAPNFANGISPAVDPRRRESTGACCAGTSALVATGVRQMPLKSRPSSGGPGSSPSEFTDGPTSAWSRRAHCLCYHCRRGARLNRALGLTRHRGLQWRGRLHSEFVKRAELGRARRPWSRTFETACQPSLAAGSTEPQSPCCCWERRPRGLPTFWLHVAVKRDAEAQGRRPVPSTHLAGMLRSHERVLHQNASEDQHERQGQRRARSAGPIGLRVPTLARSTELVLRLLGDVNASSKDSVRLAARNEPPTLAL